MFSGYKSLGIALTMRRQRCVEVTTEGKIECQLRIYLRIEDWVLLSIVQNGFPCHLKLLLSEFLR